MLRVKSYESSILFDKLTCYTNLYFFFSWWGRYLVDERHYSVLRTHMIVKGRERQADSFLAVMTTLLL